MSAALIILLAIGMLVAAGGLLGSMQVRSARRAGILPPTGTATMADVMRLIQSGQKIWAIRCYREIHKNCGLAEAKKAVEDLAAGAVGAQPPGGTLVAGQAIPGDLEQMIRAGEIIHAIRRYRKIHNCGLAEAKQAVEELAARLRA
jgi:ribosomal protein L7/L12